MSERLSKNGKAPPPVVRAEPGRASAEMKPKKAAAHRQVIQDAAKYNQVDQQQQSSASVAEASNTVADDYEGGKVSKRKGSKYDEDIQMVQDLDRWG